MKHLRLSLFCAALIAAPIVSTAQPAEYTPVTDARLKNPEPGNWLHYRGNYQGWGYSPLAKINTGNVSKLKLAWSFSTGQVEGHQAPPFVNNGYMFVTTPGAQLIALDAKTGKVHWTTQVGDYKALQYITLAPLVAKGKVMVGSSGGETGVRGFVAAYDSDTGKEAWRTYTTAAPGEPGGDTWPGDTHKNGGGSIWITGTYDPDTNLSFWGTGNPAPWPTEGRKGDNLYTTSVVAMDVDTGKIKGHHQYHHNDAWDWDEVSAPVLIDTEIKGKKVKAAVHAGRNGYLWILERTNDKINFIDAKAYVHNDVFTAIDPKTGRPSYDNTKKPGMGKAVSFCPSLWGGKDWPPEAYNPKTGLFYIPANDNLCSELPAAEETKYKKGDLYIGYPIEGVLGSLRFRDGNRPKTIGEIQAWDLKTGKKAWSYKFDRPIWAPLFTTGGGLLFAGGTNDRMFRAFDAKSGKVLWQTPTPAGVAAVPMSFEMGGEQYIAVQSGWGVDAQRMQDGMNALLKNKTPVPQGGVVMVYKVER